MWTFTPEQNDQVIDVQTTVSALYPAHGKAAALRVGSSPYDLIGLVYDSTIGKWVSPVHHLNAVVGSATVTSTTYAEFTGGSSFFSGMSNFKRLYDAGLRPQLKIMATMQASAGTPNGRIGLGINEFTSLDTATVELGTVEGSAFDSGDFLLSTSFKWVATDWLSASMNAPTENHVHLAPEGRISSGTLTVGTVAYEWRWVSA